MTTVMGCIADDFTGATDIASLLARSGYPVSLRIGVPNYNPAETSSFEVIALKTRTAPVKEAEEEALAALKWLRAAGARQFYWKYCSTFDSTAKGNIGPVAEALMSELGVSQTIYCPAFPENGRTVFMGNLFVGQSPLSESPMKDHPLTPMQDSNLVRLLQPQVKQSVGLVNRLSIEKGPAEVTKLLSEYSDNQVAHVIVDAVTGGDLATIAEACHDMALLTGGSALAMSLPALLYQNGVLSATTKDNHFPTFPRETIILSGSCSAMTNLQVSEYLKTGAPAYQLDPLALAKNGKDDVLEWLARQEFERAPLIYATSAPEKVKDIQHVLGVQEAGQIVEETLAECAVAARDLGARRIIVAGGETSGSVTQALGVERLDIGPEIAPGVPWTVCSSGGVDIALALKSGNFGSAAFFTDAQEVMVQHEG